MEQLPPIDDLDDKVIVAPSLEFGGSKVRIVAAQKTYIEFFFDGQKKESLGFRNLPGCKNLQRSFRLHQSSEPIMVLGFAIRMNQQEEGDPYMSLVPEFNQYLSQYSLVVPGGYTKNFLSVILKQAYYRRPGALQRYHRHKNGGHIEREIPRASTAYQFRWTQSGNSKWFTVRRMRTAMVSPPIWSKSPKTAMSDVKK